MTKLMTPLGDFWEFPAESTLKEYHLTLLGYEKLLMEQNYACALCEKSGRLVIDHNHQTGAVRGLLCNKCSTDLETKDKLDPL